MCPKATDYFYNGGLNCAEATLRLLIERGSLALPLETVRLASGFGGGMQRGLTCGAVTAAVMAIGSVCGRVNPEESRAASAAAVREFLTAFEEQFGALTCRELNQKYIRGNALKSEGMYRACTVFVDFACKKAAEIMEKQKEAKV